MTLPDDVTRCRGEDPYWRTICPDRETCMRYTQRNNAIHHWPPLEYLLRDTAQECEYMMREA